MAACRRRNLPSRAYANTSAPSIDHVLSRIGENVSALHPVQEGRVIETRSQWGAPLLAEDTMMSAVPVQGIEGGVNTLDEPVWTTLKRDLVAIAIKTRHVMVPCWGNGQGTKGERFFSATVSLSQRASAALRDWDLWGPLLMCFLLAVTVGLSVSNTNVPGRKSLMFAVVFIIVSAGSLVVTLNAKFLGGRVSIFQAVCVRPTTSSFARNSHFFPRAGYEGVEAWFSS